MFLRSDREFILDMYVACSKILVFTNNMEYEDFLKDERTIDAVIRNIEVLGEAVKNLSDNFKQNHDNIPWNVIARTRDKLIHFYFGLDTEIIWKMIRQDIPFLKSQIQKILQSHNWHNLL